MNVTPDPLSYYLSLPPTKGTSQSGEYARKRTLLPSSHQGKHSHLSPKYDDGIDCQNVMRLTPIYCPSAFSELRPYSYLFTLMVPILLQYLSFCYFFFPLYSMVQQVPRLTFLFYAFTLFLIRAIFIRQDPNYFLIYVYSAKQQTLLHHPNEGKIRMSRKGRMRF